MTDKETSPEDMIEMLRILASVMQEKSNVRVEVLPELLTQAADVIEGLLKSAS
jgi:hypothetical protein